VTHSLPSILPQAITESGLSWKYRQVDSGEWNVLEALGDERYRKQGGVGKGRIDRGELADARLDMPLPWDHIATGEEQASEAVVLLCL
jgi:hypothetical protein